MGGTQPTPESSGPSPEEGSQPPPPKRILSCILCQQRKIRCEKRFPCAQCTRIGSECVPAVALKPRQRRPRFPEKALLDRLRQYEDLLRHHNIKFQPMHKDPNISTTSRSQNDKKVPVDLTNEDDDETDGDGLDSARDTSPGDFWDAMRRGFETSDTSNEPASDMVKQVSARRQWDGVYDSNDHLFFLFSPGVPDVSIQHLHPTPVEAFRLWQIYLDNVNPLLKVTHTPSLQPRIIEAVGDMAGIDPTLQALLFGIYCVAVPTLTEDESLSIFKTPRGELLSRYRLGCQQALARCGFLRTSDRDCLTAHLLYLLSIGMAADPRAMSAMLGVAMRIAMRMGIHSEAALAKVPPFEGEMRRRLWWALALHDARIGELADYRNTGLSPTWDCRPPLNVNDSELWPDMKELPPAPAPLSTAASASTSASAAEPFKPTEAFFPVVRASFMDGVRRTSGYLAFYGAAFKGLAGGVALSDLETMIEDRYLSGCDPENPDHGMARWMCRTSFARYRLMENYSKQLGGGSSSNSFHHSTEAQRDIAINQALSYLERDTEAATCPRLKRYAWYHRLYFPLPGYIHLIYDLRMRPLSAYAERAWEVLSANFDARFRISDVADSPRFSLRNLISLAWDARVSSHARLSASTEAEVSPLMTPPIVTAVLAADESSLSHTQGGNGNVSHEGRDIGTAAPVGSLGVDGGINTVGGDLGRWEMGIGDAPMGFGDGFQYGMDWQADFAAGLDVAGDTDVTQLNWATMGWELGTVDG